MIEWTNGKILELIDLVRGAAVLGAVALVLYAYVKHRTLISVLVAAITAGIFLWAINNTDWWQARISEEGHAPTSLVHVAYPAEPVQTDQADEGWWVA